EYIAPEGAALIRIRNQGIAAAELVVVRNDGAVNRLLRHRVVGAAADVHSNVGDLDAGQRGLRCCGGRRGRRGRGAGRGRGGGDRGRLGGGQRRGAGGRERDG